MTQSALKDCLESVACPTCGTKVVLTRERILFCQSCCAGYPMSGDVPDFRASHAINFKKMAVETQSGAPVQLLIQEGKSLKGKAELKRDHCIVFGRATRMDGDSDITYVGVNETVINLNTHTLQIIEKFLAKSHRPQEGQKTLAGGLPFHQSQSLGGFGRDPDVFVDDRSVSRAHAVFYNDGENAWVIDLVSKNGTYVNGREIERAKLKHNDMVSLGTVGIKIKLR